MCLRLSFLIVRLFCFWYRTYLTLQFLNLRAPALCSRFTLFNTTQQKPTQPAIMPPVRTARNRKPPPAGFDDIEDTLLEFSNKMKDAENASHEGKKKYEVLWPIFQISHQRTCAPLLPPFGWTFVLRRDHPAGPFHTETEIDTDVLCVQAHDTSTTSTTKKKPSQSNFTTGC